MLSSVCITGDGLMGHCPKPKMTFLNQICLKIAKFLHFSHLKSNKMSMPCTVNLNILWNEEGADLFRFWDLNSEVRIVSSDSDETVICQVFCLSDIFLSEIQIIPNSKHNIGMCHLWYSNDYQFIKFVYFWQLFYYKPQITTYPRVLT